MLMASNVVHVYTYTDWRVKRQKLRQKTNRNVHNKTKTNAHIRRLNMQTEKPLMRLCVDQTSWAASNKQSLQSRHQHANNLNASPIQSYKNTTQGVDISDKQRLMKCDSSQIFIMKPYLLNIKYIEDMVNYCSDANNFCN